MGTTGAIQYISSIVYSFTENDKLRFIDIKIANGDHFQSGVYNRNDFKNDFYILKCE